jgi:hypothetical protein
MEVGAVLEKIEMLCLVSSVKGPYFWSWIIHIHGAVSPAHTLSEISTSTVIRVHICEFIFIKNNVIGTMNICLMMTADVDFALEHLRHVNMDSSAGV